VWEREKNAARFERKENTYFGKVLILYFVQFSRLWDNQKRKWNLKDLFYPPKSFFIRQIINKVISVKILIRV